MRNLLIAFLTSTGLCLFGSSVSLVGSTTSAQAEARGSGMGMREIRRGPFRFRGGCHPWANAARAAKARGDIRNYRRALAAYRLCIRPVW